MAQLPAEPTSKDVRKSIGLAQKAAASGEHETATGHIVVAAMMAETALQRSFHTVSIGAPNEPKGSARHRSFLEQQYVATLQIAGDIFKTAGDEAAGNEVANYLHAASYYSLLAKYRHGALGEAAKRASGECLKAADWLIGELKGEKFEDAVALRMQH